MATTNLPLPQFYAQTLNTILPVFDDTLSTSDIAAQNLLSSALDNLHLISRMITSLGVFSDNESVDEVGDGELIFMTLPWVIAECESKGGLGGYEVRTAALKRSEVSCFSRVIVISELMDQDAMNSFMSLLSSYAVLSPEERAESSSSADIGVVPRDPAKRREGKIRQYKREKELREKIAVSLRADLNNRSSS